MSLNPFRADGGIAARVAALEAAIGPLVRGEIARLLTAGMGDPAANRGGVLDRADADALMARHGVGSEELMLLARPIAAEQMARPPVSSFHVGAVGREAGTGNLIFGGNLEFVGSAIGNTVHGEGFVAARAFSRGVALDRIALSEAHPCGHCRQFLSEFSWAQDLVLIDPLGHRLRLADLFPWPFDPAYLGEAGAVPGLVAWPDLTLSDSDPLTGALVDAVTRAHSPYGRAPAAIALQLRSGAVVTGVPIESVAFNPSLGPMQTALVDLLAHGFEATDIVGATLAVVRAAPVDHVASTRALLAAVAPGVTLNVLEWR